MTKRMALVRPLLLAGLLAVGAGVVWGVAWGWVLELGQRWFGPEQPFENLVMHPDGTPLIYCYPSNYQSVTVRTLDGAEISPDERRKCTYGARFPAIDGAMPRFPLAWGQRIIGFGDESYPPTYWYFVHDGALDGSGYFVGYESQSKTRVGFIGLNGFQAEEPTSAERIPVDGRLLNLGTAFAGRPNYMAYDPDRSSGVRRAPWASANKVLEIDLRDRTVRTLLETSQILGIANFTRRLAASEDFDTDDVQHGDIWQVSLVARTPDRMVVMDSRGRRQRSYVLPEPVRDQTFDFWEIDDGKALLAVIGQAPNGTHHELLWVDAAGDVSQRREVVLQSGVRQRPAAMAWFATVVAPAPLVAAGVTPLAAGESAMGTRGLVTTYEHGLPYAWLPLLVLAIVSGALAWLCYRRQQRYAQGGTAAWVLFVFLTGLPGFLGYVLHRRWPVLAACPGCARFVPRDRECCAQCGEAFPAPKPLGTEVFAA